MTGRSLFDAPYDPVMGAARDAAIALVSGEAAAALCVIAVALFGYALLSGRISVRRGAVVVTGCFVLLGAPVIATAFMDLARNGGGSGQGGVIAPTSAEVLFERPPLPPAVNDTYGRASLRREER